MNTKFQHPALSCLLAAVGVILAGCAPAAEEASRSSSIEPVNDLPNPYTTTRAWAQLPRGLAWASVTAVEPSPDGSIYVVHRCFENSCAGRSEPPILRFNANGDLIGSFGQGMFVFPHGGMVDEDGNLWMSDAGGEGGIGHQVFKFSPTGEVLMTLGEKGVAGDDSSHFNRPTDVQIAPNGEIFVADGHRSDGNNRIVVFAPDGRYLREFGSLGSGPGQIHEPHTLAMDSAGRIFVGDRVNNRVSIFDQQGNFLDAWYQFGRPSGITITPDDTIYVTDSESGPDHGFGELVEWRKGIRIGSARDGSVEFFIPDLESDTSEHSGAEGMGVDAAGNVYGAVVRRMMLERHEPVR